MPSAPCRGMPAWCTHVAGEPRKLGRQASLIMRAAVSNYMHGCAGMWSTAAVVQPLPRRGGPPVGSIGSTSCYVRRRFISQMFECG